MTQLFVLLISFASFYVPTGRRIFSALTINMLVWTWRRPLTGLGVHLEDG